MFICVTPDTKEETMAIHINIQGSVFLKSQITSIYSLEENELELKLLDGSIHVFEFDRSEEIDYLLAEHF